MKTKILYLNGFSNNFKLFCSSDFHSYIFTKFFKTFRKSNSNDGYNIYIYIYIYIYTTHILKFILKTIKYFMYIYKMVNTYYKKKTKKSFKKK